MQLIERWHRAIYRLWSIRVALAWGAVCGLYAAWPAFQTMIPAVWFALASVFMSVAIVAARLTKQPGVSD